MKPKITLRWTQDDGGPVEEFEVEVYRGSEILWYHEGEGQEQMTAALDKAAFKRLAAEQGGLI